MNLEIVIPHVRLAWVVGHVGLCAWYHTRDADGRGPLPGWLRASVWLTAVIIPVLELGDEPLAAPFALFFTLFLAFQVGRVRGPGAPDTYCPPGGGR